MKNGTPHPILSKNSQQADGTLQNNGDGYQRLVEKTPAYICTFLPNGRLTYVNATFAALVGKTPNELSGRSFFD